MPRAKSSACSSLRPRSFAKACPRESGGQGRQAHRIRQNRQIAGGGEPDRRRLRGLRSAAQHSDLLLAAIETHQATLGCTPHLVAADAGFYSAKNEAAAKAKGVKRVCIPNRSTKKALSANANKRSV